MGLSEVKSMVSRAAFLSGSPEQSVTLFFPVLEDAQVFCLVTPFLHLQSQQHNIALIPSSHLILFFHLPLFLRTLLITLGSPG